MFTNIFTAIDKKNIVYAKVALENTETIYSPNSLIKLPAITNLWISEVPSYISVILASL